MATTFSTFRIFTLSLLCGLFGALIPSVHAQDADLDAYYPNCLYAETEENFTACHDFCQDNPNHWGCNAACLVDPSLCTPVYPDCATDPAAEGCPVFCLTNPGHASCDYICAVAPKYCPDTADSACADLSQADCEADTECSAVLGAGGCECQADQFLVCQAAFDSIACYDIFVEDECANTRGCQKRMSEDGDAFLYCVPGDNLGETDCSVLNDAASCSGTSGCFAETNGDGEFTVCVPANNDECNTYTEELCTTDDGCQQFRGLQCSCATEQQYYGCAPASDDLDPCELNPTGTDANGNICTNFEVSDCALYPEHWRCRPECLDNPAGCEDMPQECVEDPDSCIGEINPICTHAEDIDACESFCENNPDHYGCSWICQYNYDETYCDIVRCEEDPQQAGCPEYCGANPEDPACEYICATTDLCGTGDGGDGTGPSELDCQENPYSHGCPNFCQVTYGAGDTSDACPDLCRIDGSSPDCSPVCAVNGDDDECSTPYCTLYPDGAGCDGDQDKTFCQANPDAEGCTASCSSASPDAGCISFCERFPEDDACPEPINNIPGLVSDDDPVVTVVDFCGLDSGDTTNANLQPCTQNPTQAYCDVHPSEGVDACGEFADGTVFNRCLDGSQDACMGNLFLQHEGHGLDRQESASTSQSTPDTFQAHDGMVNLIFFMDEAPPADPAAEDTSGINFTDSTQSWISHLAVERTNPDGSVESEMFVNPGISFQAHPTYKWNLNTHKFKNDTMTLFTKVGEYKYALGLCDKAGNCLYSQTHYAKVVPGPVDQDRSQLISECQDYDGSDAQSRSADGKEACALTVHLEDRFGNLFVGDENAIGDVSISIKGQTNEGYNMALRGLDAFRDALRIQTVLNDETTNSRLYTGKTDANGDVVVGVASFLPSADADDISVCGDQKFYKMFLPKNTSEFDADDQIEVEVSVQAYNERGEIPDFVQRQTLTYPNVGFFYSPYVTNILSAEDVPPPADVIRPDVGIHFPVHVQSQTNVAGDYPASLNVYVNGLGGLGFEDKDYKDADGSTPEYDPVVYNHQTLSTDNPDTIPGTRTDQDVIDAHSTKITFDAGEVTSLNFGFTSRIRYMVSGDVSETTNGVTVEYPGANLGNKFCDDEIDVSDMVGGNDSVLRVTFRGADIEGGFMKVTDRIVMKNLNDSEVDGVDGDIATEAFSLNALNVDRGNIRSGVQQRANNLIDGLDAHNTTDFTTLSVNASGNVEVDGTEVDRDVVYIQGGLAVLDGGVLQGNKTIILEDANLMINGDLTYQDNATDSWGFILITTGDGSPTPTMDGGLLDTSQDFVSNIFVQKDVNQIVGTYFADGAITSTEALGTEGDQPSLLDEVDRTKDGPLQSQLVLTGALFTQNTFGGSMLSTDAGGPLDPWGRQYSADVDDDAANMARIFDLHYVRQYAYKTQDPANQDVVNTHDDKCSKITFDPSAISEDDGCYGNHHSFVIRLDRKVVTQTPPGFDAQFGYTIFDQ